MICASKGVSDLVRSRKNGKEDNTYSGLDGSALDSLSQDRHGAGKLHGNAGLSSAGSSTGSGSKDTSSRHQEGIR